MHGFAPPASPCGGSTSRSRPTQRLRATRGTKRSLPKLSLALSAAIAFLPINGVSAAAPRAPIAPAATATAPAATATAPAATATAPAATATAPAASRPHFAPGERVSAEDLLAEVAFRTGIILVKSDTIPGEITVTRAIPEQPEPAIAALNEMLAPIGYRAVPVKNVTSTRLSVRVVSEAEAKKQELENGPVTIGMDPKKIDVSERARMITHIVPLNNPSMLDAARKTAGDHKDVTATVSGTPQEGYRLILTGPALSVRQVVETIAALDPAPVKAAGMVQLVALKHLEAEGSATIINDQFSKDASGNQVLRATADKRSNSIVLSGPEVEVLRAAQLLRRMDENAPAPRPLETPVVPPPTVTPPPAVPTPAKPATRPGARLDERRPGMENGGPILSYGAPGSLGAIGGADLAPVGSRTFSRALPIAISGKRPA